MQGLTPEQRQRAIRGMVGDLAGNSERRRGAWAPRLRPTARSFVRVIKTAQAGYGSIGMTGSVLPGFSNPEFPYGLSSVLGFPGSLASALGLARVAVEEDLVAWLEA
jgi:hypothetical protein